MTRKRRRLPLLIIDIRCDCPQWSGLGFDVEKTIRETAALSWERAKKPPVLQGRDCEMGFVLSDDQAVRILNRDYRGQDKPTNVLSFATLDGEPEPLSEAGSVPIGDVILAYETIIGETEREKKSVPDHLRHLTVHGVLHLLGYDHEREDEAVRMESLEIEILETIGVENPYKNA